MNERSKVGGADGEDGACNGLASDSLGVGLVANGVLVSDQHAPVHQRELSDEPSLSFGLL